MWQWQCNYQRNFMFKIRRSSCRDYEKKKKKRSLFNGFYRPDVQKAMGDSDGASWSETKSGLE